MIESLCPSQGWAVLHLFCRLTPALDREAVVRAVKSARVEDHQVVSFAVLGHKADLGVMALGPDLWRLWRLQGDLITAGMEMTSSYVSLTEVSEYAKEMPEEMKRPRLYPRLPPAGKPAICFYPMSKRRATDQNWYVLSYEQRRELMMAHGAVGRGFAGRVLQVVTGSTGLDDHEWGVTLFAVSPDDLKDVVHTMRFDAASAHFAEFGPFYVGMVAEMDDILADPGAGRS